MPEAVLKGRVALVTGVSRRKGIGKAIAQQLAMLGADVFIHSYSPYDATQTWGADPDGISALIALLQKYGTRIAHAQGNFLDPAVPGQIMGTAVQTFGHIDILVANHAYSKMGNLEQLTTAEIDTQMHINTLEIADGRLEIVCTHKGCSFSDKRKVDLRFIPSTRDGACTKFNLLFFNLRSPIFSVNIDHF